MINKALEGEEVIITRNGEETVKLVPARNGKKGSWIGMWKGKIKVHDSFYEPLDDETLVYFTGDAETFLDKTLKERRNDEKDSK